MHLDSIEVWIAARDNAKDPVYKEYKEKTTEKPPKVELPDLRTFPEDQRGDLEELLERYRLRYAEENTPKFASKQSTRYIEARPGTTFKIMIRIHKSFDMHNAAALRLYVAIDNEWEFGYTFSVTREELELADEGGSMVGEVIHDVDYENGEIYEMRFVGAEEGMGKGKGKAHSPEHSMHLDVANVITVTAQRVVAVRRDEICVLPARSPALHASRMASYLNENRSISQFVKPWPAGRLEEGFEVPSENWNPLGDDAWKQDRSIWWDPTGDKQFGRPYIFQFRYRSKEQLKTLHLVSTSDKKDDNIKDDAKQEEEKDDDNKENEEPNRGNDNNNLDEDQDGNSSGVSWEDQDDNDNSSEVSWEEHEQPPEASALDEQVSLSAHDHIIAATSTIATRSAQAWFFDLESQDPGVTVFFQDALHNNQRAGEERTFTQRQQQGDRHLTEIGDIVVLAIAIASVSSRMRIGGRFDGYVVNYECPVEAKQQVIRLVDI